MPTPGPLELVIILVIALLILGPGRLPDVGSALGKGLREFRKASSDVQDAVKVDTTPLPSDPAAPPPPAAAAPVAAAAPIVAATPGVVAPDSPVAAPPPVAPPQVTTEPPPSVTSAVAEPPAPEPAAEPVAATSDDQPGSTTAS
jgi:TatA/E family protein of Tat protein translocase